MKTIDERKFFRGDIYYANLGEYNGSIQGGLRPVMIVQNDIGNRFSPTVIIATISSQVHKAKLPTHVIIDHTKCGLNRESFVMLEQIKTINKSDLKDYLGSVRDIKEILKINKAISLSMAIEKNNEEYVKEKIEKISGLNIALNLAEKNIEIKKSDFFKTLLKKKEMYEEELKNFCREKNLNLENFDININNIA